MSIRIRAVYEAGRLRPLNPIGLYEGQQVDVIIENVPDASMIQAALGDLVRWPDPTDDRHAESEIDAEAVAHAFSGGKPVSDMIIEDRGEA